MVKEFDWLFPRLNTHFKLQKQLWKLPLTLGYSYVAFAWLSFDLITPLQQNKSRVQAQPGHFPSS